MSEPASAAPTAGSVQRVPGYCALCVSRCGSIAVVEDGRFTALEPDSDHPTGGALCAKGRAAPELVYHPDRLLHPLKRTRPKGDPDPGWERIGWDEALDHTARRLRELARESGPESVVFSVASPSTSASDDALVWIERLRRAFGSPNECLSVELCGWGRYLATAYTFGDSVPGRYMPDLEHAGCILFWGYNPNLARLAHGVATADALRRGARLVVVDPRRVGPANKADRWLRVRPGTDAALALGLAHVMIERGWYDEEFVRSWTNGPLLVRTDDGRLLTGADLRGARRSAGPGGEGPGPGGDPHGPTRYLAWSEARGRPVPYDPATGRYGGSAGELALFGEFRVPTPQGEVAGRPVFQLVAEGCGRHPPEKVEATCGVAAEDVVEAARLLWEARPVAYYAWSGVEMQTDATQIARAIAQLHTLTGSLDARGGNVLFAGAPAPDVGGRELLADAARSRTLGLAERPLGPARWEFVTSEELYRAVLEAEPYRVRGLLGFGANLLLAHADGRRGREALKALDFYVHADLFMNPTAELADIVLPVASAFEREALKLGFEGSAEGASLVQLRRPVVRPRGQARSDTEIVFDLACRLGLGEHFWDGDIEAAYRHQLGPSGISPGELRANPGGVRVPVRTRYRTFAEEDEEGVTCAKHTLFCESQHRALPSLRRRAPHPEVELPPEAAAARSIEPGDWVYIETPNGRVRARARLNDSLAPDVVCGQHGWWQACDEIGAPGYDPFGPEGANLNLIIDCEAVDPVSGSVPHRAYLCEIRRA